MGKLRSFKCWLGWCGMDQRANDTHIWGECPTCGKVAGIVSRESVRRYIEAEERDKIFRSEQDALRKSIIEQANSTARHASLSSEQEK